jgi:hypothetical protein
MARRCLAAAACKTSKGTLLKSHSWLNFICLSSGARLGVTALPVTPSSDCVVTVIDASSVLRVARGITIALR